MSFDELDNDLNERAQSLNPFKTGQVIGENDIHIAAHARSEGLVLVTNNLREFERVNGLRLDNWV